MHGNTAALWKSLYILLSLADRPAVLVQTVAALALLFAIHSLELAKDSGIGKLNLEKA